MDTIKGFAAAPYTLNEYGCCWNNPEKFVDLNGKSATEILEGGTGLALGVSQLDTPAPGPADIVALGILGLTVLIAGGVAIYEYTTAKSKVKTKEEEEALAIAGTKPDEFTFIYRQGSGNGTNLTPRDVDTDELSYSLTPPIGQPYTVTTIEAVNNTGVLVATIDKPNHVCVRPVNIS